MRLRGFMGAAGSAKEMGMKTTLITFCAIAGLLAGCGGGGGTTDTAGSTSTDPSTTQNPSGTETSASTGTTNSPTTGAPETTSASGSDTTAAPMTTTTSDTPPGETTAGESTVGESTVGETGESTTKGETTDPDTTTGVEPGGNCVSDKDCTLLSDCCVCQAIAVDDPIPPCNVPECFIPQCDALGIDEVSCRFGTCVTEKLNCDASTILCDALPPDCPDGQLPGVNENGTCWTQGCVPISACNVVTGCADCPKSQMCVVDETELGPKTRCEPIPPECNGQPTCACAEQACDVPPWGTCAEAPNGLHCSCPNC